jgi:hypothetical protein
MIQLLKIAINLKSSWLHQARAAGIRFFVLKLCHGSLIFIHDIVFFSVLIVIRLCFGTSYLTTDMSLRTVICLIPRIPVRLMKTFSRI